jgi:hypothetical protein
MKDLLSLKLFVIQNYFIIILKSIYVVFSSKKAIKDDILQSP